MKQPQERKQPVQQFENNGGDSDSLDRSHDGDRIRLETSTVENGSNLHTGNNGEDKVFVTLNDCCDPCCQFICCNYRVCNETICKSCNNASSDDENDDDDDDSGDENSGDEKGGRNSKNKDNKKKKKKKKSNHVRDKVEYSRKQAKWARIFVYCSYVCIALFIGMTNNGISNDIANQWLSRSITTMDSNNNDNNQHIDIEMNKMAIIYTIRLSLLTLMGTTKHTMLFMGSFVWSLILYWYLTWCDPGVHDTSELVMRSKYCRICERVVRTFDHHCVWTGNCVGEGNRRIFIVYLTVLCTFLLDCTYVSIQCAIRMLFFDHHFSYITMFFTGLFIVVLIPFSLFPIFLWCNQLYLISVNVTSYESIHPEKCPYLAYVKETDSTAHSFNQGCVPNWSQFLFGTSRHTTATTATTAMAVTAHGTTTRLTKEKFIHWPDYLRTGEAQKRMDTACDGLDEKLIDVCCCGCCCDGDDGNQ